MLTKLFLFIVTNFNVASARLKVVRNLHEVLHSRLISHVKVLWSFCNGKNGGKLHETCATRTQDARELGSTCKIMPARANHMKPIETTCHLQYQTVPITVELTNQMLLARSRGRGVAAS